MAACAYAPVAVFLISTAISGKDRCMAMNSSNRLDSQVDGASAKEVSGGGAKTNVTIGSIKAGKRPKKG